MDFLRQLAYTNKLIIDSFDNIDEPNSECSNSECSDTESVDSAASTSSAMSNQTDCSQSSSLFPFNLCKNCRLTQYSIVLILCGHLCCEPCFEKHAMDYDQMQLVERPGPKKIERVKFMKCFLRDCGTDIVNHQTLNSSSSD